MKTTRLARVVLSATVLAVAALGAQALVSDALAGGHKCPRGIRSCSASQAGQPCDPNNPGIVCSAQANGSYCCLAFAP